MESGDLQCEACKIASGPVKQLVDQNPDVRLVWRHFPLSSHRNAPIAAQAAEAAGAQGKFFEMAEVIFQNQAELETGEKDAAYFASLAQWAPGVDSATLRAALEAGTYTNHVAGDRRTSEELGVDRTPTLYFNGVKYRGGLSYEGFLATVQTIRTVIDSPPPAVSGQAPGDNGGGPASG